MVALRSGGRRNISMASPAFWTHTVPMLSLSQKERRRLKARAQILKAMLKIGKQGLSPEFLLALDEALKHHELLKVKFDEFRGEKRQLAPLMAEKTGSLLVTMVGHVAVLYRPGIEAAKPEAAG
jgi:RNA-binding protein